MKALNRSIILVWLAIAALVAPNVVQAAPPPLPNDQTEIVAATDCAPVAAWFKKVPEANQVIKQLTSAPADASGTSYAGQLDVINGVLDQLKAIHDLPAAAATAQQELVDGYTATASSLQLWVQGIQSGAAGGIQSLNQVLTASVDQSKGRNLVVDGYRLRADLGGICSATPETTIRRGCPAVQAWMITGQSYVKGMWDAVKQELQDSANQHAKNAADPTSMNIGGLMAIPETWTNYFFTQALDLAVIPGPAPEATDVKQEVVGQLIGESDLYLLDMMGIWSGFLGGDAQTNQQIQDAFSKQTTALSTSYAKLQADWAVLAKTCGSTLLLPNPP